MPGAVCALARLIPVPAQALRCHPPLEGGESSPVAKGHARGRGQRGVDTGRRPPRHRAPWCRHREAHGCQRSEILAEGPGPVWQARGPRAWRPPALRPRSCSAADPSSCSRWSGARPSARLGSVTGIEEVALIKRPARGGCPGDSVFLLFSSPNVRSMRIFSVRECGGDRRRPGVGISKSSV